MNVPGYSGLFILSKRNRFVDGLRPGRLLVFFISRIVCFRLSFNCFSSFLISFFTWSASDLFPEDSWASSFVCISASLCKTFTTRPRAENATWGQPRVPKTANIIMDHMGNPWNAIPFFHTIHSLHHWFKSFNKLHVSLCQFWIFYSIMTSHARSCWLVYRWR